MLYPLKKKRKEENATERGRSSTDRPNRSRWQKGTSEREKGNPRAGREESGQTTFKNREVRPDPRGPRPLVRENRGLGTGRPWMRFEEK